MRSRQPTPGSDALAAGASYPAITVTVNVAVNAASPQINSVSVSGGGSGSATATDSTTVAPSTPLATSIWSASVVPGTPWHTDSSATLGVKLRSDVSGNVTAIRFYKGTGNNGTHIGLLYSAGGTLLAQATFSGETASGWQQANFPAPVAITANTTYVAAYFSTSGFAYNAGYFTNTGVDNAPLHALRTGVDGSNGIYAYGGTAQSPSLNGLGANYWADVVLSSTGSGGGVPDLTVTKSHTGNFTQGQTGAAYTITVTNSGTGPTSAAVTVAESLPATGLTAISMLGTNWTCTQPAGPCSRSDALAAGSNYEPIAVTVNVSSTAPASVTNTAAVSGGGETNTGNDQATDPTTISSTSTGTATSIWPVTAVPGTAWYNDSPVTVGVKFRSDVSGNITGIRFYKGAGNNGTHIGLLYSVSGTLLAQATFSGETASGWQQANFSTPVAIAANTTYVAAYFSTSGFAYDAGYFTSAGVDNAPLHALRTGVDGPNGLYTYGASPVFPASSYGDTNYWADVVFSAH